METRERRRQTWMTIGLTGLCMLLVAGLLGVGYYAYDMTKKKDDYYQKIQSMHEKSYDELAGVLSNITNQLAKLKASGQKGYTATLLAEVCRGAAVTQDMVGQLPLGQDTAGKLLQFSNQLGDFCDVLFQRVVTDENLTEEDYTQLAALETQCQEVAQALDGERNAGIVWDRDMEHYAEAAEGDLPQEDMAATKATKNMEQYPELIYDGPFSQDAQTKEPKGVTGEEVSLEKALETVGKYFPGTYTVQEEMAGGMPCYNLRGTTESGREMEVYVTKTGGHLFSAMEANPQTTGELKTGNVDELDKYADIAVAFLEERGYGECASAYAQFYYGRAIINVTPKMDEVILYPDLIKVWVDMESGEVVGMDKNNYLMNHREREAITPRISIAQARQKVTKKLAIESEQLVLIPENGIEGEKLCFEFSGKIGDQAFVVFINAETGQEQDIYQIIDGENGKFAY
ncbi:germination protein YpeB [Eubacteriales bacterium OttesenSCG-928-M02]|nr:germination protein YpeB [Eubacteriales bacterium OttesenSCG-928-M02]